MSIAKIKAGIESKFYEVAKVDDKRRITLPKMRLSRYYEIVVAQNEEIILKPRALVDPREVISKKTLEVLDESMSHLQQGRVGAPIDLSAFEGSQDEKIQKRSKKRIRTK